MSEAAAISESNGDGRGRGDNGYCDDSSVHSAEQTSVTGEKKNKKLIKKKGNGRGKSGLRSGGLRGGCSLNLPQGAPFVRFLILILIHFFDLVILPGRSIFGVIVIITMVVLAVAVAAYFAAVAKAKRAPGALPSSSSSPQRRVCARPAGAPGDDGTDEHRAVESHQNQARHARQAAAGAKRHRGRACCLAWKTLAVAALAGGGNNVGNSRGTVPAPKREHEF